MRTEGKLMLCTISELSEFLAGKINGHNVLANAFPDCDFSVLDSDCDMENENLEYIASRANALRCGVKAIDAGFDSDCLMLISDYYGDRCGCASMATFFDDCNLYNCSPSYSISDTIRDLILDTLHCFETATKDTLLIVEIR
jgi:hypothetical protein